MTSRTFTFTVTAAPSGGSNVLTTQAALLGSNQWSANATDTALANPIGMSVANKTVVTHSKFGRSPFFAVDQSAATRNILDWPGKAMWDPSGGTAGQVWFCGGGINTTGTETQTMTLVCYDVATDEFIPYQGTTRNVNGLFYPHAEAHNFDGVDIDLVNRRIYRSIYDQGGNAAANTYRLGIFDLATRSENANPAPQMINEAGTYGGLVFAPNTSAVYSFKRAATGSSTTRKYTATASTCTYVSSPSLAVTCQFPLAQYYNGHIYYTQGCNGVGFYRLNTTTDTAEFLSNCPIALGLNDANGATTAISGVLNGKMYIFHSNGNIYRCDLTGAAAYAWSVVTTIPANVRSPGAPAGAIGQFNAAAVPTLGVFLVVVVKAESSVYSATTGPHTYLWKPS